MALLSLVLYALAPFDVWATFANLLTPLAMVLLFVGEYLLRYRLHPEFERATLGQAMRAYAERSANEWRRPPRRRRTRRAVRQRRRCDALAPPVPRRRDRARRAAAERRGNAQPLERPLTLRRPPR